jgi:uracil-DNA glycosylase
MFNKEDLLKGVKKSWLPLLDNPELDKIIKILNSNINTTILPTENRIFQAFKYFELNDIKVCLIGQDPYIGCRQAMGLSFSVPKGCQLPPSLKNIFKELELHDQSKGDLTPWVKNNQFLLLNASLTVFEGQSNSHQDIWKEYTDKLIKDISTSVDKVIFVLLGSFAQSKSKLIDGSKHVIIKGIHPSPLSAYRGFFGSKIFDKLDDEYEEIFGKEIDWQL